MPEAATFGASPVAEWVRPFASAPPLLPHEWADQHVYLPETSAARGGRYRSDVMPYIRGVMGAVLEPGVRQVAIMKSHQVGVSTALDILLGYVIERRPSPVLMIHPTSGVGDAWVKERFDPMIQRVPALRALVQSKRGAGGRPESTLALKLFPNGFVATVGANSPNSFARWSACYVLGDDVNRWPPAIGDEGDPVDLAVNRMTSFAEGVAVFTSTPTFKPGRIDTRYGQSDQRRYFVPCPHCGRWDFIAWSDLAHLHVAFDDRDPATARWQCPAAEYGGCGGRLDEAARHAAIAQGAWRPTAAPAEPGLAGFHIPGMLSPFVTTSELVAKFLTARVRGREAFKVFVNTALGEPWEERGQRMEPQGLYARREDYGEGVEVPAPAVVLTAGIDPQVDRFELLVIGWGPGQERWVVDQRSIPGDPRQPETQAALLEAIERLYAHASGVQLGLHAVCIDSGYATEHIYDFVLAHQARMIFATKGFAGRSGEPIVGKPTERRSGRNPRPVRLYPLNVDDGKAEVISTLALPAPGPSAWHFPLGVDTIAEEFFSSLTAEHRETRFNKAGVATHSVWVKDRDRNDQLDCAVMALAAFRLLAPNLRDRAERIATAAAALARGESVSSRPTPGPTPSPGRRFARAAFMQGRP